MNLELNQTSESIFRKNKVYWKSRWKKSFTNIQLLFFCIVIIIITCLQQLLFFYPEFEKSSRFNQNTIYVLLTISIIILFYIGNHYIKYRSHKKIYFENIEKLKSSKISINDDFLNFKTDLTETTVNWNAIKSFHYLDDCLFLSQFNIKDSYEYLLDLKPMKEIEKNQLINFVMKNVQKK